MSIYLPIAGVSVNILVVMILGSAVGFLSGLFGVGGGFLMTPLLIFMGVPSAVAVGTQANQLVGASVSGAISHWRRGSIDMRMGLVLLAGGLIGSTIGVWIFGLLRKLGQLDLVISLLYVVVLGAVGSLMFAESLRSILRTRRHVTVRRRLHQHYWLHRLPFKMRFPKSRLYISAITPATIGVLGGFIVAIMGVGGGFFMVPAMIYIVGMPTAVVIGTSLFQIVFVTASVTILQAITTQTVDILLSLLLLVGGVFGAQIGTRFGTKLRGDELRALLALLVLSVCILLLAQLLRTPNDLYSLSVGAHG
jgi:uncharacterized membrane protein YfcA